MLILCVYLCANGVLHLGLDLKRTPNIERVSQHGFCCGPAPGASASEAENPATLRSDHQGIVFCMNGGKWMICIYCFNAYLSMYCDALFDNFCYKFQHVPRRNYAPNFLFRD